MKKKIAAIVIFIFVLVFPMVSWPALFPLDKTELNENRPLAEFPEFNNEFFINFDKFFTDHLPFRNDYIKFYSKFDIALRNLYNKLLDSLGIPNYVSKNNVLFGKEDWLFYMNENNLEYYKGTNLPSEKELASMVENAEKVNEYFISQGKQFTIFIAPNKEQIYYEFLPNGVIVKNNTKRLDVIVDYFQKHSNVEIIYPKQELLAAKEERQIYYKYDTHWNEAGGYYGCIPLLQKLGITIGDVNFTEKQRLGGDLTNMIGGEAKLDMAFSVNYRPEFSLNVSLLDGKYTCTSTNPNNKKLFLLGDSFRENMIPVIAKEYTNSYLYHTSCFTDKASCEEEFANADTIVFEAVERYDSSGLFATLEKFVKLYQL